jgi:membrane protease YdiL (CAAX protease family)
VTRDQRAAAAIAAVALVSGFAVLSSAGPEASDLLIRLTLGALGAELLLVAVAIGGALLGGPRPWRRLGLGVGPSRLGPRGLALLVLGTLALSHALDGCLRMSGLADQTILGELPHIVAGERGGRLLLVLAALGLAPAVAEELLCRGLVQRALTARFGAGIGIAAAASVFGVLHVDPIHGVLAAVLGLYLGLAAHWAGNSWVPIVCHAANNLAAVGLSATAIDPPGGPASIVIGLGLAGFCAWRARREGSDGGSSPKAPGVQATLQREPGSVDR